MGGEEGSKTVILRTLVALVCLTTAAEAGCQPEDKYIAFVAKLFGEVLMMRGTIGDDNLVHRLILGNAETGTWTVLDSTNGIACYVESGRSLTPMDAPYVKFHDG